MKSLIVSLIVLGVFAVNAYALPGTAARAAARANARIGVPSAAVGRKVVPAAAVVHGHAAFVPQAVVVKQRAVVQAAPVYVPQRQVIVQQAPAYQVQAAPVVQYQAVPVIQQQVIQAAPVYAVPQAAVGGCQALFGY